MKKLLALVLFVGLSCLMAEAWAVSAPLPTGMVAVPLATITNDHNASVSYLKLMLTRSGAVRGIYMQTASNSQATPDPKSDKVFWLNHIESGRGVVIGQGHGVKAIFLGGQILPNGNQGMLTITYISNGISKHYKACQISLQRQGPADWQLVNLQSGQPVNQIEIRTWMLGISTLTNVCPTQTS